MLSTLTGYTWIETTDKQQHSGKIKIHLTSKNPSSYIFSIFDKC